jgi:tRNA (cmo5U34)-methyltransferase
MAEAIERMHVALEREGDKPATVEDQLMWLQEAGFKVVECVWKYYHIAVILGIK